MTELSIQERIYPDLKCFGCGQGNEKGLRLKSYLAPDGMVRASFTPWPEHNNGLDYLNGGVICTLLDCHSAAVVMQEADNRGWPPLPGVPLSYVTAGLDVRYLRPTPLDEELSLRGRVVSAEEGEMTAKVELVCSGKVRASATAVWKRWRPRP